MPASYALLADFGLVLVFLLQHSSIKTDRVASVLDYFFEGGSEGVAVKYARTVYVAATNLALIVRIVFIIDLVTN
jgi:hypothetical protein